MSQFVNLPTEGIAHSFIIDQQLMISFIKHTLKICRFSFGIYTSDWTPDPCFVKDHTTWMTNNSAQINASYSIMEELYRLNSSINCPTPAQSKGLAEFHYIRH